MRKKYKDNKCIIDDDTASKKPMEEINAKQLKETRNSSNVSLIISVIAIIIQWNSNEAYRNADFIHRFKVDFFTDRTNNLIMLLDNDLIKFKETKFKIGPNSTDTFAYFEIDTIKIKQLPYIKTSFSKKIYTDYDMDVYVLNHFESLGEYLKKDIVDIDFVNEEFGYYVDCVYNNNNEIQKYIEWSKSGNGTNANFENFTYLYYQLKKYNNGEKPIHGYQCWQQ